MRTKVKAMSYGLAYGLSAFGLSKQLRIETSEAKALMADYFARFGAVRDYLRNVVEQAKVDGYTTTIFGRRRPFADLSSNNRVLRENAARQALNSPIQGSAADILKRAMIEIDRDMAGMAVPHAAAGARRARVRGGRRRTRRAHRDRPRAHGRRGRAQRAARGADRHRPELGCRSPLTRDPVATRLEFMPDAPSRKPTAIDAIAENWVTTMVDLDPDVAIWAGLDGRIGEIGDTSPAGHERYITEAKKVIAALEAEAPVDDVDVVTKADICAELGLEVRAWEAKLFERDVNVIASPAQGIREIFDLMPHATEHDWSLVAKRLGNVPGAIDGYIQTLRLGIADGVVPARRQVAEVAGQVRKHADPLGFFFDFTAAAALEHGDALPASLAADLRKGAAASAHAYARLAEFLETELAPVATERDAIGRELYELRSQHFLGAAIDLDETYEWGREELERMIDEQTRIANEIKPGASVARGDSSTSITTSPANCTAPRRSRSGCRSSATARWPSSRASTSISRSPSRCSSA